MAFKMQLADLEFVDKTHYVKTLGRSFTTRQRWAGDASVSAL